MITERRRNREKQKKIFLFFKLAVSNEQLWKFLFVVIARENKEINMNFPENSDITPQKTAELKDRIARLGIDISVIEEKFVKGGGKGGQKINKTANAVQLYYPPLDINVRCQRERKRSVNRFLALREMIDRIEMIISPETSERLKEIERIRRKKRH